MNFSNKCIKLILYVDWKGAVKMKWIKKLFSPTKQEQRTFCYCPNCRHEMIGDGKSFIEDTNLVKFACAECGNKSEWNFDIAPVALVVRSDCGYTDFK